MKENFVLFKEALLKEFCMTAVQHKIAFSQASKRDSETYVQYKTRIEALLGYYLTSRNAKSYDDLVDLLVADKIKDGLHKDLKMHVVNLEQADWFKPARLVDICDNFANNLVLYSNNSHEGGDATNFSAKKYDWRATSSFNRFKNDPQSSQNWRFNRGHGSQYHTPANDGHANFKQFDHKTNTQQKPRGAAHQYSGHQQQSYHESRSKPADNKTDRRSANINRVLANNESQCLEPTADMDEDTRTGEQDLVYNDTYVDRASTDRDTDNDSQVVTIAEVHADFNDRHDFDGLQLDKIQHVPLYCEGSYLSAISDNGEELTCVNSNKFTHDPVLSLNKIKLRGAFGSPLLANLAIHS